MSDFLDALNTMTDVEADRLLRDNGVDVAAVDRALKERAGVSDAELAKKLYSDIHAAINDNSGWNADAWRDFFERSGADLEELRALSKCEGRYVWADEQLIGVVKDLRLEEKFSAATPFKVDEVRDTRKWLEDMRNLETWHPGFGYGINPGPQLPRPSWGKPTPVKRDSKKLQKAKMAKKSRKRNR